MQQDHNAYGWLPKLKFDLNKLGNLMLSRIRKTVNNGNTNPQIIQIRSIDHQ